MKTRFFIMLFLAGVFIACSNEKPSLMGEWQATWVADPSAYPDSLDADKYRMKGVWTFNEDQTMSILAYGCKDCIFGEDTLSHSQRWEIRNDSIFLISDRNIEGLVCKIIEQKEDFVKLQLLRDMFVNLEK
ncbi:MAG: hypothetical protein WBA74_04040 [Cyclobacteriaceae bacterium]